MAATVVPVLTDSEYIVSPRRTIYKTHQRGGPQGGGDGGGLGGR